MFVQDIPHNGCAQASFQFLHWKKPYLYFCTRRVEFQNEAVLVNVLLCLYKTYHTIVVVEASVQFLNCKKPCLNFCTFRVKFQNDAVLVNVLLCLYKTYHTMVVVQAYHTMVVVQDISHNGCGTNIRPWSSTVKSHAWTSALLELSSKMMQSWLTFYYVCTRHITQWLWYKTYHTMVVVQDISHNGCGTRHITQWLWYKTYHTMVVVQT